MSKTIKDIEINPRPMFYAAALGGLRQIAIENGYALAIHGTLKHDLDLIAIKWNNECKAPDELVKLFIKELSKFHFPFSDKNIIDISKLTHPELRYNNQWHYSIPILGEWYVDLTIIDSNK